MILSGIAIVFCGESVKGILKRHKKQFTGMKGMKGIRQKCTSFPSSSLGTFHVGEAPASSNRQNGITIWMKRPRLLEEAFPSWSLGTRMTT
jgi:hypothetical protein